MTLDKPIKFRLFRSPLEKEFSEYVEDYYGIIEKITNPRYFFFRFPNGVEMKYDKESKFLYVVQRIYFLVGSHIIIKEIMEYVFNIKIKKVIVSNTKYNFRT